jgi:ABC-type multidrug transport system fused ATPase/permease subunit
MSAADLAAPWPLALALDRILRGHRHPFLLTPREIRYLGLLALVVVAISLIDAIAAYLSSRLLARAGERIAHGLRVAAYSQLQNQSLHYHLTRQKGDLVTTVTSDVNGIGDFFESYLGDLAQSSLLVAGMVAVTMARDPVLGLVAFATIPVIVSMSLHYRRLLGRHSRAQRVQDGKIASLATEALSAMPVIKAFGSERYEHDRVWLRSHRRQGIGIALGRLEARFDGATTLLGAVGIALVLVVGVFRVASGAITAGELIVFAAYARRINTPLRAIARDVTRAGVVGARAERVAQILATDQKLPEPSDAYHSGEARGDIELDSVTFSYEADRPVLHDFSLEIPAGERCALMGPSGAGKSSVGALIARFYDPMEGSVRIDGRDVRDCSVAWLREQVGVLLQDTVLFTGTVRENIAYGLSATTEEVIAAAQAAAAHDFIQALPHGYDTRLGPQGVGLSGGQRQRIGIARTLLRDPSILLLDEPTTGLDRGSEEQLLEGLSTLMKGRTTILISHSPDLVRTADRVVVINGGRIVADGPPEQILAAAGLAGAEEQRRSAPELAMAWGADVPPWS